MTEDRYDKLEKWMAEVDKKLDNHLVHTASDISQIKNDLDWIKRFFWLVAGVSLTALFGVMITFLFK